MTERLRLRDRLNEKSDRERRAREYEAEDLESYTLEPMVTPGLGAWRFFYKFGWKPTTDRQRAGLHAFKQALIDVGFGGGIDLAQQVFGNAASNRTIDFQRHEGLVDDGVIGPNTARRLFAFYFELTQSIFGIPDHLLAKIGYGESNDDPIAEGVTDNEDEGILQFHLPFWPGVTLAEAWDPLYEINRGGQKLAALFSVTGSWKGAVAAWNIGSTYAKRWVDAGYPAKGGPIMGTDPETGQSIYAYERATAYWNYIEPLPYR